MEKMSDLIERQAAIDALINKGQASRRYKLEDIWELNLNEIREAFDTLPSAQPEDRCSECDAWNQYKYYPRQPEIVRCKDCKYYIPYEWMFDGLTRSSNRNDYSPDEIGCSVNDHNYPPDGFCSFGERRGDGV